MTLVARTCSECDPGVPCPHCGRTSLAGMSPRAKTCCENHKKARQRRIARTNRTVQEFEEQTNSGTAEIARIVRREAPDLVTKVMTDELAPIVREAITEDVLRAVRGMLNLVPDSVQALKDALDGEDESHRQRAAHLVMKYTAGNPTLVKPDAGASKIEVNFGVPAPPLDEGDTENPVLSDAVELRECEMCHLEKPTTEFVGDSERCNQCHEEHKQRLLEKYGAH